MKWTHVIKLTSQELIITKKDFFPPYWHSNSSKWCYYTHMAPSLHYRFLFYFTSHCCPEFAEPLSRLYISNKGSSLGLVWLNSSKINERKHWIYYSFMEIWMKIYTSWPSSSIQMRFYDSLSPVTKIWQMDSSRQNSCLLTQQKSQLWAAIAFYNNIMQQFIMTEIEINYYNPVHGLK